MSFKRNAGLARTAADLAMDEEAILSTIDLPEDLGGRLMELGFLPGHPIRVVGSAPGGDPRVYRVDGTEIALRKETSLHLLVESD
jgi:Fe2+ transport system protein FeoA